MLMGERSRRKCVDGDDVGCWHVPNRFYEQMREAGVEVRSFLKVRFLFCSPAEFTANHRKISQLTGARLCR